MKKKFHLETSKFFCLMPWVHLHFLPDSSAHACCMSDSKKPVGNFSITPSIKELYNSKSACQLRKNMMDEKPSPECQRCYELESHGVYTLRKMSNESFGKYWDGLIPETKNDGQLTDFKMRYLDIRFSNICNFKCQTCGPLFSSAWYDDQKALYSGYSSLKINRIEPMNQFMSQIQPLLDDVEKVYFAGGEPIVTEEIYQIMDYWLAKLHLGLELSFTTNFSLIQFKEKNILDYWNKFKHVRISASLDDSGPRAEYLRKGTIWKNIESNRNKMLSACPKVYFEITPTISLFNVWHFPEFHLDWVKRNLVEPNNIRLNILTNPRHMTLSLIPLKKRKKLITKWIEARDHLLEFCENRSHPKHNILDGYNSIIHYLENEPEELDLHSAFLERLSKVDAVRKESLFDVFPELIEIFELREINE